MKDQWRVPSGRYSVMWIHPRFQMNENHAELNDAYESVNLQLHAFEWQNME